MLVRVRPEPLDAYRHDQLERVAERTYRGAVEKRTAVRLDMTMVYVCEVTEKLPVRKISGLRVFSIGEYRGN